MARMMLSRWRKTDRRCWWNAALLMVAAAGMESGAALADVRPATETVSAELPVGLAALLIRQAIYWMEHGQPAEARRSLDRLRAADPDNADAAALLQRLDQPIAQPAAHAADDRAEPAADSLIDSGRFEAAEQRLQEDAAPAVQRADSAPSRSVERPPNAATDGPADAAARVAFVNDPEPVPLAVNPFRGGVAQLEPAPAPVAQPTPAAEPSDEMSAEIDRQIRSVQEDLAPKISVGPTVLYRTGTLGLGQLFDVSGVVEGSFSPWGTGQLTLTATPTYLNAGQISAGNLGQFGSLALASGAASRPALQEATGVGLDAVYARAWFKGDVGTTPLGFTEPNVIGGIELAPRLSDVLTLRLIGERRAVTDSLLSYAGTVDPRTGTDWGGVTRTRAYARLEGNFGPTSAYVGGGYSWLDGTNVASNEELQFDAGAATPLWRRPGQEVRIGLDAAYFSYSKNLDYFTLGQGGYFSPQSYVAVLIPVSYRATSGRWTWSIGGAIGLQAFSERASPVFPDNPALQDALQAQIAAGTSSVPAHTGGQSVVGVAGNGVASFDYRVTPTWSLGGQVRVQYGANWTEAAATLLAHYTIGGVEP